MELPRLVVALLVVIWAASFVCFAVASQIAFVSGTTFEYRLYGIQFPYVAFALLVCMAASSGVLWANYKGQDFRGTEELIYGCFFGLSSFGLMLSVNLVLSA